MNASPILVGEAWGLSIPANNQTRSSERRRRLREQLKLECARLRRARERLQLIEDYVESLRELEDCGSDFRVRYPAVAANMARAAAEEDDRIFAIRTRVGALDAQMRGYK
jgi:hypothetical protein